MKPIDPEVIEQMLRLGALWATIYLGARGTGATEEAATRFVEAWIATRGRVEYQPGEEDSPAPDEPQESEAGGGVTH